MATCNIKPMQAIVCLFVTCLFFTSPVFSQDTSANKTIDTLRPTNKTADTAVKESPPRRPLVQSPFYDAIALIYTIRGYKAYPLIPFDASGNQDFSQPAVDPGADVFPPPTDKGPALPPESPLPPEKTYRLIECATGKVLKEVTGSDSALLAALNDFRYSMGEASFRDAVIDSILLRNIPGNIPPNITSIQIRNAYNNNSYIQAMLADHSLRVALHVNNLKTVLPEKIPFALEGGAAPSVSMLLEGYTEFLIQRVNEEFNDAFLVHLYHALNNKAIPEFAILFPNTLESLKKIELTEYSASLNAIKTAYQTDIRSILSNIGKLATLQRYKNLLNRHPVFTTLFVAADVLDGINKKIVPAQLLYLLGEAPYITGVNPNNYCSVVKLAVLVSNCLRDIRMGDENPEEAGWLDLAQLKYIESNPPVFNAFMGFLAQGAVDIEFTLPGGDRFNFQQELLRSVNTVNTGRYIVYNFSRSADKIKTIAERLKKTEGKTLKTSDYVTGFIDLSEELLGLSQKCLDVLPTTPTLIRVHQTVTTLHNTWLPVLKQADTVLIHVEDKDYQMAVYAADRFLQQVFDQIILDPDPDKNKALVEKLRSGFLRYGLFIASVATAKSSADVKDAISAFALPRGSSRIKKERTFTVGLNAYVGVYHAFNRSYPNLPLPKTEWGITAPLGIGINLGLSPRIGKSHLPFSLGLYGGLLDVGAIFTYKVQGKDTLKSDIQLGQVFSPSAGIILGLPIIRKYNIPFAIGANIQWGPKLRKVEETGNSIFPLLVKRYTVFMAFDLPVLNLYTSRTKTKR
jgi:hypothetical protein